MSDVQEYKNLPNLKAGYYSDSELKLAMAITDIQKLNNLNPLNGYNIQSSNLLNGKLAYLLNIIGNRTQFVNNNELHDICEFLGSNSGQQTFTPVTTLDALEIVSSSTNDTANGTGTRTIKIVYLDNNGNIVESPNITLNGTTPVPAGFTASAIFWMEATSGGSAEVSVGNIDLKKTGASIIYERIAAGGNKSLSGRIKIPANFTGYLLNWGASAINQPMDVRLRATTSTLTRGLNSRYLFQERIFLSAGQTHSSDLLCLKYPTDSQIKISAIPGGVINNARCDVNFYILIIQN